MIKRLSSFALILLGAAVTIFSLTADPTGFGADPRVVGWKQLTAAAVGIYLAIFGLWINQFADSDKSKSGKDEKK